MIVLRDLQAIGADEVRALVSSREAVVAVGSGELHGYGAAALLLSDYAVLEPPATLKLQCGAGPSARHGSEEEPAGQGPAATQIAGLVWRLGSAAYRLLLSSQNTFTAAEAMALRLCDSNTWSFNRSELAFESAARVVARRGGDALERAEFARLFASGEPQEGLTAFLQTRAPAFKRGPHVA